MLLQKLEEAKLTSYALDTTTEKYPDECFYLDIVEGAIMEAYLRSLNSDTKELIAAATYDSCDINTFTNDTAAAISKRMLNDYCEKYLTDIEEEW